MRVAVWGLGLVLVLAACGGTGADQRATTVEVDPNNAAFLAVVEGQVTVRRADGTAVPAVAESTLARSDTLVTGPDGRVVVVLHNRHVVKLGTSLEKRVETLAHFDDPPPSQDLAQLFEEALGVDYERLGGKDKLERIAGWNARRAAGETPAPVAKAPPPSPRDVEEVDERAGAEPTAESLEHGRLPGGVDLDDAPKPPVADRPADPKKAKMDRPLKNGGEKVSENKKSETQTESSSRKQSKDSIGGEAGAPPEPAKPAEHQGAPTPSGGVPAPDLANEWTLETGSDGQVQRVKLPGPLIERRAALARCIVEAGKTTLTLEVEGGTIKAARFGAQAASCASGLVGVKLPDVADATVTIRLRK